MRKDESRKIYELRNIIRSLSILVSIFGIVIFFLIMEVTNSVTNNHKYTITSIKVTNDSISIKAKNENSIMIGIEFKNSSVVGDEISIKKIN